MEYVKEVFAQYDRQCIRVYQAYNPTIAKGSSRFTNLWRKF